MIRYKNLGGDSSVEAYEIEADRIIVQFNTGRTYTYSYASAGIPNVEEMKRLAEQGKGLCSFINHRARKLYE